MKKFQISIFKILYIKCPKCPGTSAFVSQSLGLGRPVPEWDCPVPIPTLPIDAVGIHELRHYGITVYVVM